MADVTVTRAGSGQGPVAEGVDVELNASVIGGSATAYEWRRGQQVLPDTGSQLAFTMNADQQGDYTARAQLQDGSWTPFSSPAVNISLVPAPPPGTMPSDPGATTQVIAPKLHPWFAVIAAIVLVAIGAGIVILTKVVEDNLGLTQDEWSELEPNAQLAARLVVPIAALGLVAVLVGIWMAVVEWRGQFKEEEEPPPTTRGVTGEDVSKVIESIGKLRGAALVLVAGAILMISAAWVASSAARQPDTTNNTTTSNATTSGASGSNATTGVTGATGATGASAPTGPS